LAARILLTDDDVAVVQALKALLKRKGYEVAAVTDGEEALAELQRQQYDLLLTDIVMEPMSGLELLRRARELYPHLAVIVITGHGSVESALQAKEVGAFDYVTKPFRIDELLVVVQRALAYEQTLAEESGASLGVKYCLGELVGESPRVLRLAAMLRQLAGRDEAVLLQGEAGTGREQAARTLHGVSSRAQGPVFMVECSLEKETQLEARLFGGEKQPTALRRAHGGTLLLLNVDKLPTSLQIKLTHLLQTGDTTRAGGARQPADTRVVMTAVENLETLIERGEFSDALFHELRPAVVEVPPLRERLADLPMLVQHFLNRFQSNENRSVSIDAEALAAMERYHWPGNLGQLEKVVKESAAHSAGRIRLTDLPTYVQTADNDGESGPELRWKSLNHYLDNQEMAYVKQVLEAKGGNRVQAAAFLEMELDTFEERYGHLL